MAKTKDNKTKHCNTRPRFPLGGIYATPGALAALTIAEIHSALARHHCGDWGDACPASREANELSVREGFRILSVYRSDRGGTFWVITEADRSSTAILLPEEY